MKTLNDYIRVFPVLSKEDCDRMLQTLVNCNFEKAITMDKDGNPVPHPDRKSAITMITGTPGLEEIDAQLFKAMENGLRMYIDEYRTVTLSRDEGLSLLRYEVGEEYKEHNDSGSGNLRTLSAILYLNDNYVGGELEFTNIGRIVPPVAGQMIIFPSNFCYPHRALPITSGTKYAVVTWLK